MCTLHRASPAGKTARGRHDDQGRDGGCGVYGNTEQSRYMWLSMTDAKTLTGRVNTQRSRGTYGWRQSVAVAVAVGAMWNDRTARRGQSLKEG